MRERRQGGSWSCEITLIVFQLHRNALQATIASLFGAGGESLYSRFSRLIGTLHGFPNCLFLLVTRSMYFRQKCLHRGDEDEAIKIWMVEMRRCSPHTSCTYDVSLL